MVDILKHGTEVKALAPQFLQDVVQQEIEKMHKIITASRNEAVGLDNGLLSTIK